MGYAYEDLRKASRSRLPADTTWFLGNEPGPSDWMASAPAAEPAIPPILKFSLYMVLC